MVAPSAMGLMSLFMVIVIPVYFVLLLISVYRLNKNSELQVEQNKKIIDLLGKLNGDTP